MVAKHANSPLSCFVTVKKATVGGQNFLPEDVWLFDVNFGLI